jgi:septation ring formation regulator EzrA
MNFKSTLILSSLIALSLTSCSVYYTTTEVDSSLKSTVDQVNATIQKLDGQVATMEKEFQEIQCDQKSPDFVRAYEMLTDIDAEMKAIGEKRIFVNQIYVQFKDYTKGKDKIQSGTPEWEKVKDAKVALKSTLENIQTDGNAVVENATAFNAFVTKSIVPTIQLCDVATYTTQFEKAISDLTLNQKKVGTELTQYQKQVTELISKYSASKPALCKELSNDLQKINTDVTQISRIKMNLQMAVNSFKTNTPGKTKIYSCSSDWKVVTDAETAVNAQQKEANALQQSIQTTATHLQTLVIALGQ